MAVITSKGIGVLIDTKSMRSTISNLNALMDKAGGHTLRGMVAAALRIKNSSVRMTPIEFGNLRGSAFVVWSKKAFNGVKPGGLPDSTFVPKADPDNPGKVDIAKLASQHTLVMDQQKAELAADWAPGVVIGHTAYYAIFVHENEEAFHEKGQAKFLEKAIEMNAPGLINLIAREAKGLAFDTRKLFDKKFKPDGTPK